MQPSSTPCVDEKLWYKNILQEHAQKSGIQLPLYQTVNEGPPHAPQFRSTVIFNGITYRSPETFTRRKDAEQSVAKLAFGELTRKVEQEQTTAINYDTVFSRVILNEYAVKMNLQTPTYTCNPHPGLLPTFISSVTLSGNTYQGITARSKKDALQLAARAAIDLILGNGNPEQRAILAQVIRSKDKFYTAITQVRENNEAGGALIQKEEQGGQVGGKLMEITTDATLGDGVKGESSSELVNPVIAQPVAVIAEGASTNVKKRVVPRKILKVKRKIIKKKKNGSTIPQIKQEVSISSA